LEQIKRISSRQQQRMTAINELEPLLSPIAAIQYLIEKFDNRGIVIDGVAASILGKPRLTADADAMLLLSITPGDILAKHANPTS
jgi:hypothetical protein